MLPTARRLRRSEEFTGAVRTGRRAGASGLIVHLTPTSGDAVAAPRAGFIVGRAVGPAVVRNQVRRRLRHLVAARLDQLPDGSALVVRALPASAGRSSQALAVSLDRALAHVTALVR